jgi:beta-N-acetylhexosaminidase
MRSIFVSLVLVLMTTFAFSKERFQKPGPIHLDADGEKWAEKTLRKLSTEEKVGQLFMVWARAQFLNDNSDVYAQLHETMEKYHVGGFAMTVPTDGDFLFKSEPFEATMLLNHLQAESKLPLIFAADFERGLSMRLNGTTVFPHSMAFGAAGKLAYAESFGRITAEESRAIGIHWNFFPVADVNSNPLNPVINTRSFGEDPQQVGELVRAYIKGAHEGGMLTTAKHFPGHGDTASDTHLGVARVDGDMAHLNSIELPPFERAIEAGVDSVMVAHVTVPALDPDPNHVATISPSVVTNLLRGKMKFSGIVSTDALDMAGLTKLFVSDVGRAAVEAFKAGNDLLLIPADLGASYRAMVAAVKSGEISEARLDESVLKLLKAKASLGLHKARLVDVSQVAKQVSRPENVLVGQQVADDAVTLVRDNGKLLPLKAEGTAKAGLPYMTNEESGNRLVVVVLTNDVRMSAGRAMERQLRGRVPGANVIYVDVRIAEAMTGQVLAAVDAAEAVVVASYANPIPGSRKNAVALPESMGALLNQILEHAASKTAVVAMGNPYVVSDFPKVENYLCTFSSEPVSELSAVKGLFGEIAIHGHLPVSIPNVAQRGAGLERQARLAKGDSSNAQNNSASR